ncbi:MAG: aminoglycoside nucleotidyltransferase [Pseudomonadota bacterium]
MKSEDVVELYTALEKADIRIWIDGGWGVDALLGGQTRPHGDLDIVIQQKDVLKLRELLEARGYKDVKRDDTSVWNFVLGDDHGRLVDIHVIVFDAVGNGLYGSVEKGVMYPAASLSGTGVVDGCTVRCISAEYMLKFHTGYKLRDSDFKDVSALCEKFGIEYPEECAHLKQQKEGAPEQAGFCKNDI